MSADLPKANMHFSLWTTSLLARHYYLGIDSLTKNDTSFKTSVVSFPLLKADAQLVFKDEVK